RDPVSGEPDGRVTEDWAPGNQPPVGAQPLPDGGMLVVCRGGVFEFDKQKRIVNQFIRTAQNGGLQEDIVNGPRVPRGDTVFLTTTPNGPNCFRLDAKLKDTGKSHTLGRLNGAQGIDVVGENNILVCEPDKVAEYDLRTGKLVWKYEPPRSPTGAMPFPN